jgi:hypothetical protein
MEDPVTRLIRNCLLTLTIAAAMWTTGAIARAAAQPRWPATCHTFACVDRHLNQLHAQLAATRRRQAQMFACLFHLPAEWVEQTANPYLSLADPASPDQPGLYAFVQRSHGCTL